MLGLFISTTANAGPFYRIGYSTAQGLAESAWDNIGRDCRKLNDFKSLIKDSINDAARDMRTKYQGESATDFSFGYQAGLMDVLKMIRSQCAHRSWDKRLLDEIEQFLKNLLFDIFNQTLRSGAADSSLKHSFPFSSRNERVYAPPQESFSRNERIYAPSQNYSVPMPQSGELYRRAYQTGNSLAEEAWNNLGQDCMKTSLFLQIIGKDISEATVEIGMRYNGRPAKELVQGYIEGVMDVLDNVLNRCLNQCR